MVTTDELRKQAARTIKTLSVQNEEFKKRIADLEREKHASELVNHMVDNGIVDSEDRVEKVAELVKCSEEDFKTTIRAVSMVSKSPTLGQIKVSSSQVAAVTMDPVTQCLWNHINGEK